MDNENKTPREPRNNNCSFCGRPRGSFKEIVENPTGSVGICNDCISICKEILDAEARKRKKEQPFNLPTPEKIKKDFPAVEVFVHIIETDEAGQVCFAVQNLAHQTVHSSLRGIRLRAAATCSIRLSHRHRYRNAQSHPDACGSKNAYPCLRGKKQSCSIPSS